MHFLIKHYVAFFFFCFFPFFSSLPNMQSTNLLLVHLLYTTPHSTSLYFYFAGYVWIILIQGQKQITYKKWWNIIWHQKWHKWVNSLYVTLPPCLICTRAWLYTLADDIRRHEKGFFVSLPFPKTRYIQDWWFQILFSGSAAKSQYKSWIVHPLISSKRIQGLIIKCTIKEPLKIFF